MNFGSGKIFFVRVGRGVKLRVGEGGVKLKMGVLI